VNVRRVALAVRACISWNFSRGRNSDSVLTLVDHYHTHGKPCVMRSSSRLIWAIITLVACSVVACATSPPRSDAERTADAAAAAQVEAALNADPRIYARHIDVTVNRGVVHLGGYVWSDSDFLYAKNDAASVPGITTVVNQMDLTRGGVSGTSR
jgi:hypothetical protein